MQDGCRLIETEIGRIESRSSVYRTASWGNTDLPEFLNQAIYVLSGLSPHELLAAVQLIEKVLGRKRIERWGSRTLDIDILFYDNEIINEVELTIPHPLLHTRRFALTPLEEIASDLYHPVSGKKIKEILSELSDDLYVEKVSNLSMSQDMNKTTFDVDMSYLNDIADGNAEFIIDMIDIFLEQTPAYFEQLSNAIREKDWKMAGDVAHKIKPTLTFMGAAEAKEQMAEIEHKARALEGVEEIEEMFINLRESCNSLYSSLEKIKQNLLKG